jgi:hypothetical protein
MRIVDEVKIRDTPLHTALSHLEARSREIDPWSVGIEIRVTPMPVEEAAALPHVSLNHRGASLLQIVQAAADQVGLDVALSADGIQLQRGRK